MDKNVEVSLLWSRAWKSALSRLVSEEGSAAQCRRGAAYRGTLPARGASIRYARYKQRPRLLPSATSEGIIPLRKPSHRFASKASHTSEDYSVGWSRGGLKVVCSRTGGLGIREKNHSPLEGARLELWW